MLPRLLIIFDITPLLIPAFITPVAEYAFLARAPYAFRLMLSAAFICIFSLFEFTMLDYALIYIADAAVIRQMPARHAPRDASRRQRCRACC